MPQNNDFSQLEKAALTGIVQINLESRVTANVIDTFRNVFPSVNNYVQEVITNFKAFDETDAKIQNSVRELDRVLRKGVTVNFATQGHHLVQIPEGFKEHYVGYLNWLGKDGLEYIDGSMKLLDSYYQDLAVFISNKEAKLSKIDHTRSYAEMEKQLTKAKEGLASFFDPGSMTALAPIDQVFDRQADVQTSSKAAIDLNRRRIGLKPERILSKANAISELLSMLVDSTKNKEIPEVSGESAKSIAQGAFVAARYVEFVGVLQYRIEEAINAMAICVDQISNIDNK